MELSAEPMSPLTEQILEQKRLRRVALAQLSYPDKVRIVEKLRDTSLRIAAAARQQGLRKPAASASSLQLQATQQHE